MDLGLAKGRHMLVFFLTLHFEMIVDFLEVAKIAQLSPVYHSSIILNGNILHNDSTIIKTRQLTLVQCVCVILSWVVLWDRHHKQDREPQRPPVGNPFRVRPTSLPLTISNA